MLPSTSLSKLESPPRSSTTASSESQHHDITDDEKKQMQNKKDEIRNSRLIDNNILIEKRDTAFPADSTPTSNTNATSSSSIVPYDFIGSSNAVKDIFCLPYSPERSISLAIHNIEGTLLVDTDPEGDLGLKSYHSPFMHGPKSSSPQGHLRNLQDLLESDTSTEAATATNSLVALSSLIPRSDDVASLNSILQYNKIISSPGSQRPVDSSEDSDSQTTSCSPVLSPIQQDADPLLLASLPRPEDYVHQTIPPASEPREFLSWRFHDLTMLVGSDALIYRSPETAVTVRVEDSTYLKEQWEHHEELVQSGNIVLDDQHPGWRLQQPRNNKLSYAEAVERGLQEEKSDNNKKTQYSFSALDLDRVKLQTCIIPKSRPLTGGLSSTPALSTDVVPVEPERSRTSSALSTVLDAYLDNIMANVPQLALCLQQKGFIQSVKLLDTECIPAGLFQSSTIDASIPFEVIRSTSSCDKMFSPQIMEMNASALLKFLKTNCTNDNSTYLFRRQAGDTKIQLYDISSISSQRQQKWNWWLAMMSYRFANRLRQLAANTTDVAMKRSFRNRQRSLLQNTLDLLEALADFNGNQHESLLAAIRESLADSFLVKSDDDLRPGGIQLPVSIATEQPYAGISSDSLNKAHDHLSGGIKAIWPVMERILKRAERRSAKHSTSNSEVLVVSISSEEDSDDENDANLDMHVRAPQIETHQKDVNAVATQLFGLHLKLVQVSLRLAEIHLNNYFSSNAMHFLRICARKLADALFFMRLSESDGDYPNSKILQKQYVWLWEHCGRFARSFAADELWRDRGHASGEDVISVLQDVEAAFKETGVGEFIDTSEDLTNASCGTVSLQSLSGVVNDTSVSVNVAANGRPTNIFTESRLQAVRDVLDSQKLIQREQRRVLVAACVSYDRCVIAYRKLTNSQTGQIEGYSGTDGMLSLLQKRLGDACNECGKILLNELRLLVAAIGEEGRTALAADPLLSSAEFWFVRGLAAFEQCMDIRNIALLRCNLCQCFKIRANAIFTSDFRAVEKRPTHAEIWLEAATNQLQAAHEAMGQRDADPKTWDMVSDELAATFLVLGVRRRQSLLGSGNIPLVIHELRLSPGQERSIVDPMYRSLVIYEQLGNSHQAAAAHYQLAQFFSKVWTCQRDEAKTREKLAAAFRHYTAAHVILLRMIRGNEVTFCLLSLDLSNLYSTVSGEECLSKAVRCCLGTADALSLDAIEVAVANYKGKQEWFQKMSTVATSIEERLYKLLRSLSSLELEASKTGQIMHYKELYRAALQAKVGTRDLELDIPSTEADEIRSIAKQLIALRHVLKAVELRFCVS